MSDKALAVAVVPGSAQAIAQFGEMSVQGVIDRKRKIVEVMNAVMRDGEHYGKIPGCGDKPALLKAGAETLAATFGLRPKFKVERSDLPGGHREYEIICTLVHIASGLEIADGLGSATTMESKHRWRNSARLCPQCGKPTIIKGRADYGGGWLCYGNKGGCGAKWKDGDKAIEGQETGRVENPDPADQYNTVLKMAKKRAQVDATLTAIAASDVLTQDLDDLPPGSGSNDDVEDAEFTDLGPLAPPPAQQPARQPPPTPGKPTEPPPPRREPPATSGALTEDELVELMTSIGKCGSEPALKQVGRSIPYGRMDASTREKFARAYEEQLTEIRAAVAAEQAQAGQ